MTSKQDDKQAKDYKDSINLPKTSFSMKANLAQREPAMLEKWQQLGLYQKLRQERSGAKKFILLDGPPYANGKIHVGHAVNKILKDMTVKSQSLQGLDAPFIPTWDCHGLPIEIQVEKKVGKVGKDIDAATFREKCRTYAKTQVDQQREDFERLGVLADWQHPSLTMGFSYEANEIRGLAKIIERGHLHKGARPVHWCPLCASSLAEAEVEYQDKESNSIDVLFPVVETSKIAEAFQYINSDDLPIYAVIWTTTPWTLPANMAVTVGEEIDYSLVYWQKDQQKRLIIVASLLVDRVLAQNPPQKSEVLATCKGTALFSTVLQHPFYDRQVPILTGEHVTTESGTGLVHTAPAHGADDFIVAKANNMTEIINVVGPNGCFLTDTPLVGGQFYAKANPIILEALAQKGHLWASSQYKHSYPHCWRHKKPVIFRATPQWFLSMTQKDLGKDALAATETVNWIPKTGQVRIQKMLANRPDWCISRQRTWGVPLAFFTHKETDALHPDTVDILYKVADVVEKEGVDGWFSRSSTDFLGDDTAAYVKGTDILDVWFDSGSSNYCLLDKNPALEFPADLYLEGSDQHRGWFQTSLLTSVARCAKAPYRNVVTHGFVVDAKGHKMSKSLGNIIAPQAIVKTLGADILRLWAASIDYHAEIHLSDEILKRTADTYRRLRNTTRFLLGNLYDFEPLKDLVRYKEMLALDQWALQTAYDLQKSVQAAFSAYEFHRATQSLHHFSAILMGGFYLDILKDRLYTCRASSLARRSAQTALYHILAIFVRCLSPIISFTADEIWDNMPGKHEFSVFMTKWYDHLNYLETVNPEALIPWDKIMLIRDEVNKAIEIMRVDEKLGSALEAKVTIFADNAEYDSLTLLGDELKFVLITSGATLQPLANAPNDAITTGLPSLKLAIEVITSPKCIRCYHRSDSVAKNADHPALCARCIVNISTKEGEVRQYA